MPGISLLIRLTMLTMDRTDNCAYHLEHSERNVSPCESTVSYPREHCLDVQFRIETLYLLSKKRIDVFSVLLLFMRYYNMRLCKDTCLYLSRLLVRVTILRMCCLGLIHQTRTFRYTVPRKKNGLLSGIQQPIFGDKFRMQLRLCSLPPSRATAIAPGWTK